MMIRVNGYVRNQMMTSEPTDTEDFVRQVVRAEQFRIRIGDSTARRGGLEPVSWRVAAEETEDVKRGYPDVGAGRGGKGRPWCNSWGSKRQRKEGVHKLQGTPQAAGAMAMQAEKDS